MYVQNKSALRKSHWPPGYLVQINNISSYHSWSLSDHPKWQPYVQQSKENNNSRALILLNESSAAQYFLFRGAAVVKLAFRVLRI